MSEESFFSIGQIDGAEVAVQHTGLGQDILVRRSNAGQKLVQLLDSGSLKTVRRGEADFWSVPHSSELDRLLVELIDVCISIRYAHPTLVQLELALAEDEVAEPDQRVR